MLPTLRQFRYLIALADNGSFSRAADAVHVTQPTLSAGIAELEAILGQVLIDRGARGGGLMLTPAGQTALATARSILMATDDLVGTLRAQSAVFGGPFRLGAIPTIAPYYLADVLRSVQSHAPNARLMVHEDQSQRLIEGLSHGTLDAAILALPYPALGMMVAPIFDDALWLVCPPDHPLALLSFITQDDLVDVPFLLMQDGHCLREHALAVCETTRAQTGDIGAASLYTLAHLVAAGHGLALIPDMAVRAGLARTLGLVTIAFAAPQPSRKIALLWRAGSPAARDAAMLANLLKGL